MRIVSYNILNGGEGRADPVTEVIEAQRPDVVALIEADVPATVERIARRLSMDFVVGAGKKHACALLCRWPIAESINHAALVESLTGSFLEASVQDPSGLEWPVGVVHLPAGATEGDEEARLKELAIVLDSFKEHRRANRPHLLCGDFNSNAPYQRIDPARCKIKTQEAWKKNGGKLPRRVIHALMEAGYLDTYHALHDEEFELIGSFDTQHPGQRVDYIFSFAVEPAKIKDARVEQDRLAKYASDHYPIFAEIG